MKSIASVLLLAYFLGSLRKILSAADKTVMPRLRLLSLMPFTGQPPNEYKSCQAITQLVVNMVNNRSDILSNYFVELQQVDDNLGPKAPTQLIAFERQFVKNKFAGNETYKAPVINGQISGCETISSFLHFLDFIEVSACSNDYLYNNRYRYPNLYPVRPNVGQSWIARLRLVAEIGKWNYFAILIQFPTSDLTSLTVMHTAATRQLGMQVYADAFTDFTDESAMALKTSDARVMVLSINGSPYNKFLCQAYKFGMTGPKYVFITSTTMFVDPSLLSNPLPGVPNYCTKEIIAIQSKYAIMVSSQAGSDDPNAKSSIGYSMTETDQMFNDYTNKMRETDYGSRFLCHDLIMQTLLILDSTEKTLNGMNLSLKNMTDLPGIVARVTNETASKIDYAGLAGRKQNGKLTSNRWTLSQWDTTTSKIRNIYMVLELPNSTNKYDYYSYQTNALPQKITWLTADGKAPKDRALQRYETSDVDDGLKIAIFFLAALFVTLKIAAIVHQQCIARIARSTNIGSELMPITKSMGLLGFIVVDCSAVLFIIELKSLEKMVQYQVARVIILACGLCLSHISLFARVLAVELAIRKLNEGMFVRSRTRGVSFLLEKARATGNSVNVKNLQREISNVASQSRVKRTLPAETCSRAGMPDQQANDSNELLKEALEQYDRKMVPLIVLALLISLGYCIVWAVVDPTSCILSEQSAGPVYFENEDTFLTTTLVVCVSKNEVSWMLALLCANVGLLVVGGYFARKQLRNGTHHGNLNVILAAMINSIILLLGSCLALLAIADDPVELRITIALCSLVNSTITSAIICFPQFRRPRVSSAAHNVDNL